MDENAAGACAQLVFAPIDESFADDDDSGCCRFWMLMHCSLVLLCFLDVQPRCSGC